jgi:hypothetical protein
MALQLQELTASLPIPDARQLVAGACHNALSIGAEGSARRGHSGWQSENSQLTPRLRIPDPCRAVPRRCNDESSIAAEVGRPDNFSVSPEHEDLTACQHIPHPRRAVVG